MFNLRLFAVSSAVMSSNTGHKYLFSDVANQARQALLHDDILKALTPEQHHKILFTSKTTQKLVIPCFSSPGAKNESF